MEKHTMITGTEYKGQLLTIFTQYTEPKDLEITSIHDLYTGEPVKLPQTTLDTLTEQCSNIAPAYQMEAAEYLHDQLCPR